MAGDGGGIKKKAPVGGAFGAGVADGSPLGGLGSASGKFPNQNCSSLLKKLETGDKIIHTR